MQIIKEKYIYEFSPTMKPAFSVQLEEEFIVETLDCYSNLIKTEKDKRSDLLHMPSNGATGPIYIENVQAGDTISIEILDIEVKNTGVMITRPNLGVLGDQIVEETTRIIPIEKNEAYISRTTSVPLAKMIGVIGVAPKDKTISTVYPGEHGGNLDTKYIRKGSTIHLPIWHDGGLLALGDLHGAMGDGEMNGTGLEVAGKVTLKIFNSVQQKINSPIIETDNKLLIIQSAPSYEEAARLAVKEAVELLQQYNHLSFENAYRLVTLVGDLEISQVVNPLKTLRVALPKEYMQLT